MRKLAVGLSAALIALAAPALAHDNSKYTVGLGFSTQFTPVAFSGANPGAYSTIDAKLPFTSRLEGQLSFGFAVDKSVSAVTGTGAAVTGTQGDFTFALKGDVVVISEENMNLYLAAGIGLSLGTINGLDQITYFVGPGVEFFFSGLPRLGFFAEFGVGGNFAGEFGGHPIVSTFGSDIASVGLHYYF
jgi:hypothetical protein